MASWKRIISFERMKQKIIEQLADADGIDYDLVYANETVIDNLIEAAVHKMQEDMLIELVDVNSAVELPPEAE